MAADLRRWLAEIGLEQLAGTFAANDIDLDVLPDLSDEDLKELGLTLGHRRRLLRAVGELPTRRPQQPAAAVAPNADTRREPERRQLTVLFCDLVGSTELSGRHDPEDLRDLLSRYHDAMTAVVERYGGYVANYLGDGVLAYFGWPRAEEDEAAQAVRAGLAAVAAAKELSLHVHVGIASGTVVVGDIEGAGRRQVGAIAGETPNLAARLEALAGPDQVVIGGLTRRLIGRAFILDDLGPQELKGIAEPVRAWQVLAERSVESRFDARAGRLTPFIGREHEVALLIDRFERAAAGEGQAVLLSGEAGIGKSRLVQRLHERLSSLPNPPTRIRMQCSPFHTTTLLHPVFRQLEYAAGFLPKDTSDTKLDKLEALLRQGVEEVAEGMALLAPLLSLPTSERYGAIELVAEQRKERVLRFLGDQLRGLALGNSILLVLEDAHWIDPATREFIEHLLPRIADAPILMMITYRPEFQLEWTRHPHVTALTLSRLSRGQGSEVVRAAGGAALSEDLVARIGQRAGGVPLFIEELTKSVLDSGSTFGDSEVPETLQASLLARLDRLGPDAKELAQIAAVIGREFGAALLRAITGKSVDAFAVELGKLVASEIVLSAGSVPDGYAFRHALIQDAAYQSLLLSRRRQYHGAVAEALESGFPEIAESQPELIAQHYTAAERPDRAIPFWLRAGERSRGRSAVLEAIGHFERGIEMARHLPEGAERSRQILALLLALGEARRLTSGQLVEALATCKEAAEIARAEGAPADLARAALAAHDAEIWIGRPPCESVELLEAALHELGDANSGDRACVLSALGRALFALGNVQRANALTAEAVAVARHCGDKGALYYALSHRNFAAVGNPCPASRFAERRRGLDEELALIEEIAGPQLIYGFVPFASYLEMGDYAGFAASLIRLREYSSKHQISTFDYGLASADAMCAILLGEFAEAERLADRALEIGEVQGDLATGVYGVQMFTIRREQGRLAEVAPLFRRFLDENPRDAAWRPGLAVIASDLGFEEAARKAFAEMAAAGFAFPADAKRSLTLSYLAEVCTCLGDALEAERLYDQLLPYRDNAILAPVATVCCGAASRYLGMLAGVMGEWAAAEEHFEAALDIDEQLNAWPWLAHTKHEFALALTARGRAGDQSRAEALFAAAAASAERIGMPALQQKIRSRRH
ncbi:MAG: guanylate cyclase [Alphaproteobacteria bacterium]|nr:MAG: guanylate cyclase [Alphaproteobacteria bacterium]